MKTQSSANRYLKGKIHPETGEKIKSVEKDGAIRIIHLTGGKTKTVSKQGLTKVIDEVMSAEQKAAMTKTIRKTKNGVNVTIGGHEKGERKSYKTEAAAKAALSRYYGQ